MIPQESVKQGWDPNVPATKWRLPFEPVRWLQHQLPDGLRLLLQLLSDRSSFQPPAAATSVAGLGSLVHRLVPSVGASELV